MKISKVNNRKTAVSAREKQEGILYKDPLDRNASDIAKVVDELNRNAKVLYDVFNQNQKKGRLENYEKAVLVLGRDLMSGFKPRSKENEEPSENSFKIKSLKNFTEEKVVFEGINEKNIEDIVYKYIRKGLKKGDASKGLAEIFKVKFGLMEWDEINQSYLKAIYMALKEDFFKEKQKASIVKSIKNQDMLVQLQDGTLQLSGSNIQNKNKINEKEGFKSFLSDYSCIDKSVRDNYLRGLRRLLLLYFYGEGEVPKDEFNVWNSHSQKRKEPGYFIKIDEKKYLDKDNKEYFSELKEAIRKKNIDCYRSSKKIINESEPGVYLDLMDANMFWIHHIENAVERIYAHRLGAGLYKFNLGYLSEKVWKDMLNFMSIKYIAIGKAVFQFAMKDLESDNLKRVFGEIDTDLFDTEKSGISSFDYEQIKAIETLQREMSTYIAFAANNLGRQTISLSEGNEDFLAVNDLRGCVKDKESLLSTILSYFGGKSRWEDFPFDNYFNTSYDEVDFLRDIRNIIFAMRNENFHFSTMNNADFKWEKDLISKMFCYETFLCTKIHKDKLYSNNLVMFYKTEDLKVALDKLYSSLPKKASQIPAYNRILSRKSFGDYLKNELKINAACDEEDMLKFQGALYYLLKEIYYNVFLQDKKAKKYFIDAVKVMNGENPNAIKDFKKRIDSIENWSLPEICQGIMTEYARQNANRNVKSARTKEKNPDIFQHYRMLLYRGLLDAFTAYVKETEIFKFVFSPQKNENELAVEDFLPDWTSPMYEAIAKELASDSEMQKMYITAHFLHPKQINMLAGSLRSFIQFSEDIERRAKDNGNSISKMEKKIQKAKKFTEVLDTIIITSGNTTNIIEDYYKDKDAYAVELSQYVDYHIQKSSPMASLQAFCMQEEKGSSSGYLSVYFDGNNPILNKNVVFSKLYGSGEFIGKVFERNARRITEEDIKEYYQKLNNIASYRDSGICKNKKEQANLKEFQNIKNRIELQNVLEYSELINELLGQCINWAYLRERDLMYFQLGFHYLCLHNHSEKPSDYKNIECENVSYEKVILYQIAAMYLNGLPVLSKENELYKKGNGNLNPGNKIPQFLKYAKGMGIDDAVNFYYAGLEVFENIGEHDNIVNFRNYIDHFKLYTKEDYSILDMYSEIMDRFFAHDMKYAKGVPNALSNILGRHMLVSRLKFETAKDKKVMDNGKHKDMTSIVIDKVEPDLFEYTIENGKFKYPAKSKEFIEDVLSILYYPSIAWKIDLSEECKKERSKGNSLHNKVNFLGSGFDNLPPG